MIATLYLIVFIVCVFVAGAILAWPLSFLFDPQSMPMHKLIGHATLLCGFVGAFAFLAINRCLDRAGTGYAVTSGRFVLLIIAGMIAGNVILLTIEIALLALGLHGWEPELTLTGTFLTRIVVMAIITGLVVAVLEETIFRGAIFTVLLKRGNPAIAVIASSLAYALVHFLKYPALAQGSTTEWYTGLILLSDAFNARYFLGEADTVFTLFLLGVILAQLRYYTGNIALSIGLHAGLVMMMKLTRELTDYVPGSNLDFLVNNSDHQLGLLSSLVLVAISLTLAALVRPVTVRTGFK